MAEGYIDAGRNIAKVKRNITFSKGSCEYYFPEGIIISVQPFYGWSASVGCNGINDDYYLLNCYHFDSNGNIVAYNNTNLPCNIYYIPNKSL